MPQQVNASGNPDIDALLWGYKWDFINLSVRFPTSPQEYQGYAAITGFEAFTQNQQDAVILALRNITAFTPITFTLSNQFGGGNFRFAEANSVDYGDGNGPHQPGVTGDSAEAIPPSPPFPDYAQGDTWYNHTSYQEPDLGTFGLAAGLLHEFGHALGLKHGHLPQTNHGYTFPALPADHDSQEYSVMTYRTYPGQDLDAPLNGTIEYPWTFMQNDIAALQYMYGPNFTATANGGNTIYSWHATTGELTINENGTPFSVGLPFNGKIFLTVWDGGGSDTYDFSNFATNMTVNLNPGQWTTVSQAKLAHLGNNHFARGNIANALLFNNDLRSLIENANGGSGADTMAGNVIGNTLRGNGGNDFIFGLGGNDFLDGGTGADRMSGGLGDDLYTVDSASDVIVELASEGADQVNTSLAMTLGANLENMTLLGSTGLSATGNSLVNRLQGNAGANTLDGKAGNDVMVGIGGNDIYMVDAAGDQVFELAGLGSDRVLTTVSFALAATAEVELLKTTNDAGTGAINLTGGSTANHLIGNAGANTLDGRAGSDIMQGLGGNDIFMVDAAGDRAVEAAGKGSDRVLTSVSFTLEANSEIELLRTTNDAGTGAIKLTGNNLANFLMGNAGANTLDGKAGNDILQGLGGNDFYYVDSAGDRAVEAAGKGADRVFASASFTLEAGAEVETLTTTLSTATTAIKLTGNSFANMIVGNAGANTLDGKAGVDLLQGLGGNDFFHVDHASDRAVEAAGGGADRVFASASYSLEAGSEIETLTTTLAGATTAINLTGNAFVNAIVGNAGGNVLNGLGGNDTLLGLGGADFFLFNSALNASTNVDRMADFNVAADTVRLENAIFTTLAGGTLVAGAFRTGSAALDADDRIIYNSAAGTLTYDSNGNAGGGATLFATLGAGLGLTNADFLVV